MASKENMELRKKQTIEKLLNKEEAEKFLLEGLMSIRELDCTNGIKNKKEKRLGNSAITVLCGRSSRSEKNTASLTYTSRVMTAIRTNILHKGIVHHAFEGEIKKISEKYPLVKDDVLSLSGKSYFELKDTLKKYKVIKEGMVTSVIKKIEKREGLTKKKENKAQLKKALSELRKLKLRPVFLETFIRTKEQKENLSTSREERLDGYASSNKRYFSYENAYKVMNKGLSSEADWESLAFGLALASGRRSTEILCDYAGKFEKVRNKRECKFTTTIKTEVPKTFNIPILVDFDVFITALDRLRSISRVKNLNDKVREIDIPSEREKAVNSSVQQQLSWRAKELMEGRRIEKSLGGKESPWSFKDSRAMYAQITYIEYKIDCQRKAKNYDDKGKFFTEKLGHTAREVQENYRQFRINDYDSLNGKEIKSLKASAKDASQVNDRLGDLEAFLNKPEFQESRAKKKYSDFVLDLVAKSPEVKITSTLIKEQLGGNKGIISEFVRAIKEAGLQKPL